MQYQCNKCRRLNPVPQQSSSYMNCNYCSHGQEIADKPWKPGAVLGFRFAVIQVIGKGGHGYVCMCRDILEDRNCVLKITHRSYLNERVISSFLKEAQQARDFIHPNLVRSYGGGIDGRVLYVVEDWVCGLNLVRYEKKIGRFTLNQLMYLMHQCCQGLKYLWEGHGLIHCDVKPENILVNNQGEVFLTDFGMVSPQREKMKNPKVSCTPEYVAPEVVTGEDVVDFRSDIYSLGASFFRLISGYDPYKGRNSQDTIMLRFKKEVPDLRNYSDVTKELAFLIHKMMRPFPHERFQSYEVLIKQIEFTIESLNHDTQYYIQGLEGLPHVQ